VVVTVVEGLPALAECLAALGAQEGAPRIEVVVPYDDSISWVGDLSAEYPWVRFLTMGPVQTSRPADSPAGQHELFDRRRAVGLSVAGGRIIGILEDRGVPEASWAATVVRLHASLPHAVIGGAVECGVERALAWAVYFCDFSRYQLPLEEGPRRYVTDVNVSYKRDPLMRLRELWQERYHETTVHWQFEREGEVLYLTPEMVVHQRRHVLGLGTILRERLEWGRLFAYTRGREIGLMKRIGYAVFSLALPVLLFVRHARTQVSKRTHLGRFVSVSPLVALLLMAWSAGEMMGYVTGRP
jgi:hypothetical protein